MTDQPEYNALPDESDLVDGINEFELAPGLSTRFGYCSTCRCVYPPETVHQCAEAPS